MNRTLLRLLRRDAWAMRRRLAVLVLVVLVGTSLTATLQQGHDDLASSYQTMYRENRFADLVITLEKPIQLPGGPDPAAFLTGRGVPGLANGTGRLVVDGTVQVDGATYRALLIGIPGDRWPAVNDLCVAYGSAAGGYVCDDAAKATHDPVVLGNATQAYLHGGFARYHHIARGTNLVVTVAGHDTGFQVKDFAQNSEFIVTTSNPQFLVPEKGSLAVLWVNATTLGNLVGAPGTADQILLRTQGPHPAQSAQAALAFLRAHPDRFADLGIATEEARKDTFSYSLSHGDLQAFQELTPSIGFLVVVIAGATVAVSTNRLVAAKRREIGVLRALGLRRRTVVAMVLGLALLAGVLGGLLGAAAGWYGSRALAVWYQGILGFPVLVLGYGWTVAATAVAIGVASALAGALMAGVRAARLPVVEAVAAPSLEPPGRLSRALTRGRRLAGRLALRNLTRHRGRAIFTVGGLAFALVLSFSMVGMSESMSRTIDHQFAAHESWDGLATLDRPRPMDQVETAAAQVPGVGSTSPLLAVAATVRGLDQPVRLVGLPPGSPHTFTAALGTADHPVAGEVLVSAPLANALGDARGTTLRPGDTLTLRVGSQERTYPVASVVDEPYGDSLYMPLDDVQPLVNASTPTVSGFYLVVAHGGDPPTSSQVAQVPGVVNYVTHARVLANMQDFTAELQEFASLFTLLGAILGIAVLANTVVVNLQERELEHGTLRTLGASVGDLTRVLAWENLAVGILASAAGVALGLAATEAFLGLLTGDFPMTIQLNLGWPTLLLLAAAPLVLAQVITLAARHSLRRMDLPDLVKRVNR